MQKLILLFVLAPHLLFAEGEFKRVAQIYRTSTEIDPSLKNKEAVYEFQFRSGLGTIADAEMMYSIDGKEGKQVLKKGVLTIRSTAGKHKFQFYYNSAYSEVYSDSLAIKARYKDVYSVTLYHAIIREEAEKPVIYLYPQLATDVSVKVDIHGEDVFMYPKYEDAWKCTAHPNGDLVFGDQTYNYLFWEASFSPISSPKQMSKGFFVEGKNSVQFLEEKLTMAGLNSKEQADFITYWAPRLSKNTLNFLYFDFNEECDYYANIEISPKPDNIYRIFMVWGAVPQRFNAAEQDIKPMDRSGFHVLEWGGQETHFKNSF